jgi:hypothetical protein
MRKIDQGVCERDEETNNDETETEMITHAPERPRKKPVVIPQWILLGIEIIVLSYILIVIVTSYDVNNLTPADLEKRENIVLVGRVIWAFGWWVLAFGVITFARDILQKLQT